MGQEPGQTLHFPPFRLPPDLDLLYRGGGVVPLEPQAVRVLRFLIEHRDRVVTKEELLDGVWPNVFTTEAVLKKAVSQIRRALGDDADQPRFVTTYHRRGYRFVGAVAPAEAAAAHRRQIATRRIPDFNQLVGRDAEMQALQAEQGRSVAGDGSPTIVIGEPGIGKTQLARHFQDWAAGQGARCLYGRFSDYRGSRLAPFEVFLDLLRAGLGSLDTRGHWDHAHLHDLRARALDQCGVALPAELFAESHAGGLPGGLPSAGDRFRAIVPLADCFARLSEQQPLVVVLDDIQWADEGDRDLIADLMRLTHGRSLFPLLLARRDEAESTDTLAAWLQRQSTYRRFTSLALRPLAETQVRPIVEAIFGAVQGLDLFPADLKTLHRVSGGNPYFLVEMLRLLLAEDVIHPVDHGEARWRWTGIRDVHLPDTLVMAARVILDRLPPAVRQVSEEAAVIGDEFRLPTLAAVSGRPEEEVEPLLREGLVQGVFSERGLSAGEDYRFEHGILRQVLYDGLPPRRRRGLHLATADALATIYAQEADRVAAAMAAHYEASGDRRRTFEWSLRAGRAARTRWQWPEVVASAERAQRAADALAHRQPPEVSPGERLEVVLALAESYASVGRLKSAEAKAAEALAASRKLEDRQAEAAALIHEAAARIGLGAYREAKESAVAAVAIGGSLADAEATALALVHLASAQVALGNYDAVMTLVDQALDQLDPDSPVAAAAAAVLGWAHALQGRYDPGVTLLERALRMHDRTGDLRRRALVLRRLHWVELSRGRYERAIELALRARDDCRRVEDVSGEAKCHMGIGEARIAQGLTEEGISYLNRTLESLKVIGDSHCEAETLWLLGRARAESRDLMGARELLERALAMVRQIGDRDDEFRMLTDVARVCLAEGHPEAALAIADEAVAIADQLRNREGRGTVLVERGRALTALGRAEEAAEVAREAVALLEEAGSGERWRAWRALAAALRVGQRGSGEAVTALERCVALLTEMRGQLAATDADRREAISRARGEPAATLASLLRERGQAKDGERIAAGWRL